MRSRYKPAVADIPSIDVLGFRDARTFLQQVVGRTQGVKGISLRALARKAGFSSPSLLSMVMNGQRRLTTAAAERVADALALQGRRRRYFLTLALLDRARSQAQRMEAQDQLFALRGRAEEHLLESRQYRFLSTWYYPALYVLAGMADCPNDAEALARRLRWRVTAEEVRRALADLEELNLISVSADKVVQTSGAVSTAEDVVSPAVYHYHKRMLALASRALDLPLGEREFNGLTIGVPPEQMPVVKERIRAFRKELNEYLSQFQGSSEVYQLNMQLFPVTQSEGTFDDDELPASSDGNGELGPEGGEGAQ